LNPHFSRDQLFLPSLRLQSLDKHSFFVRQLQEEVERTPSWLLKEVRVMLVFADLEEIRVQTSMEAISDV
jgi:hypothetical protein